MQRNILFALTLFSTLLSTLTFAMGNRRPEFEVHGHRGARAREPENTLPAFVHALQAGANVLEADLGVTNDGYLVLNHDFEMNPILCHSRNPELRKRHAPLVNSLTLAQVETYDCGSSFDKRFPRRRLRPQQGVLRFDRFLQWLKSQPPEYRHVKINIETKIEAVRPNATVSPEAFVNLIVKTLYKNRFDTGRVILQSFDFRTLRYAKKRYGLTTSALVESPDKNFVLDVRAVFRDSGRADYLSPDASLLTREHVVDAQALGMKVVPWTLNRSLHWSHFIGIGVDGIITDDPKALLKFLESRARRRRAPARL